MPGRSYAEVEGPQPVVLPWPEFQAMFVQAHKQGEHIAIVGRTGTGKTVTGLELCKLIGSRPGKDGRPSRVTVLAYKPRDDTMRMILPEDQWPVLKEWPPGYAQEHCIVWVRGGSPGQSARRQRAVFLPLLDTIYQEGGQTVYIPEAAHFERKPPDGLGMGGTMTEFWSSARSLKLTVISDTQRPRWVTVSMWTEPAWLIIFRPRSRADLKHIAELSGHELAVWSIVPKLGTHEFLCVRDQPGGTAEIYVSKVIVTRDNRDKRKGR